jgi:hypothetical protein
MAIETERSFMATINPNKAGIALGTVLGGWHLFWAILVAIGWAQPAMNFVFWLHSIKPIYVVEPFNPAVALLLIAVTSVTGYMIGFTLVAFWNWMQE